MADTRRTVLVTGCSPGGIGHALCLAFQAQGLRVFATARKTETIADLAEKGIETLGLVVDDEASVKSCFVEVEARVGSRGLDYLVNNAGRNYTVPALDIELSEVRATFATNLFAVMSINATFAPLLLRSRGTFVHIGSIAGKIPYVFGSVYNASKAALHAYCNTLRVELAPFGVSVIDVITGGVKSNIARVDRVLPESSVYASIDDTYQRRQKHSQEVGMDTKLYAEEVVTKLLRAKGWLWDARDIWAGSMAGVVWWADWIHRMVPGDFWGFIITRMFNLNQLAQIQKQKKTV